MKMIWVAMCSAVVLVICISLVLDRKYDDSGLGRSCFALIGLAAAGSVLRLFDDGLDAYVSGIGLLLWTGIAMFFIRHYFRYRDWKLHGSFDWRDPNKTAPGIK